MTELDIHKCLFSYGTYPMTMILHHLEMEDRFEDCQLILDSMTSYKAKFKNVTDELPTKWSKEFEEEYFSYFKKISPEGELLAKGNLEYYIKDIMKRLKL